MSLGLYETSVPIDGLFYNIFLLWMMEGPNKYILNWIEQSIKRNKNRATKDEKVVCKKPVSEKKGKKNRQRRKRDEEEHRERRKIGEEKLWQKKFQGR